MDNSLISQIADIEAIKKNLQAVVDLATKTAENLGKTFKNSVDLNFSDAEKGAKALENLTNTVKKGKQQLSDYSKAQENLAKAQANAGIASEKITETIAMQAKSVAELTAKNKVLEAIKKNLNSTDSDYLSNIAKINEAQNANNQAIAETNNLEQKRTSGIGKYEEAIRNALGSNDNYKTQLLKLRNTMADLEIAIEAGGDSTGELAQQYDLLEQKAGQVADAQGDMQARIKYLADDYGKFKAVLSGVRAAMGIVSVFSGFTDILGIHSKRLDAVTAKMTALIATMQGLKEVQELLNKDNYFRQLIKTTPAIAKLGGKLGAISKALKGVVVTAGIASTAFAAFIAVIAGFGVVTKKVVEKDLKKTKDEIDKIKASTDNATTVMTNFGKSLNMTKFDGLVSQLQNVAKSVKEVIAEFVRMSVMTAITDKLTEAINAQLNATMVRLRNEQKIKKLEEKKRGQEATNTENARLRREAQAFTGGAEHTSAAQLGDIIPTATEAQKVKEYENAIDELKIEIKEADKVASGFKSEINELVKNSAEITATTTTIVTDALAGLFPEIEAFRKLQPEVKKATETIKTETKEAVKAVKSIPSEEEMHKELLERASRKLEDFLKEADKNLQVDTTEDLEKVLGVWDDFTIGVEEKAKITFSIMENFAREITRKLYAGTKGMQGFTVEELQFIADKTLDLTKTIGNQLNTVLSGVLQNAIKINEKEMKLQEEKVTRETENAKIVAKERIQDEQMLALELERIDVLADQKKRKLLNEQAKRNFIAEQANFALQALVAFASTVAYTTGGIAVKLIAGGIAAAAVGAEALAHAAKGVPKYEEGGEAVANQPFIAGEAGSEIGIGKSGKLYNFDREKLYMANENIKIFNHADSDRLKPKLIENHTFTHDKAVNITVTRDYITDDRQQYINKYLKIRK